MMLVNAMPCLTGGGELGDGIACGGCGGLGPGWLAPTMGVGTVSGGLLIRWFSILLPVWSRGHESDHSMMERNASMVVKTRVSTPAEALNMFRRLSAEVRVAEENPAICLIPNTVSNAASTVISMRLHSPFRWHGAIPACTG